MNSGDNTNIGDILEQIKNTLKTEMETVKAELKEDIKTELDSIRAELRTEARSTGPGENPPSGAHVPPPHFKPFEDFPEPESSGKDSHRETREFDITGFTGIRVGGAFEVEIRQSDLFSVSITAEQDLFRNLRVSGEGDILSVGHSRHIGWRARLTRSRLVVTMPVLKELRLSGAVKAAISGFNSSENLKMDLSGASMVNGDIRAGNAEFDLSGASRASLTGSAGDVIIKASGANHLELRDFTVNNAAVKLSGVSHATANVSGRLDARLSGVTHFSWTGDPVMGDIRTSGASTLGRL
jgi:hypothetical protein